MARLKSRPLHHTMKRKSQDKDRVHRENSRASSSKRPRLQSPSERQQTITKKAKKKRVNVSHKTLEDAHLPPELRKAGLMAHIAISKGKCFGPFKGRITNNRKPPGKMHFLVSQMADRKGKLCFFYACKNEKDKCSWLSRLQSAVSEEAQNIVAYKNSSGVYFEAVKDIAEGEELLVLFDESFKESGNTSDRESTPTVSYITDESGGKIAVVPLGREVDASKVFVHPVEDDDKNGVDGVDIDNDDDNVDDGNDNDDNDNDDDDNDGNDNDGNDNDGNDNDDIDNDDDEDIDYGEEDGVSKETDESFDEQDYATEDSSDENDDSDEVIGSDDDFVPENQSKPTRKTAQRKRISEEGVVKMKKENEKQQPSIKELPVADSENDTNSVKYCCSHCLEEFPEKGEALAHTAAMECLAKEFQCSTCRLEFTDASLLQNHLCGGKPRCKICDEEFEERAQLQAHKKTPPTDHRPRCAKCDVQFESSREKNQHARTKHGSTEKQAECPICQKTYNKSYLKDHMITHSQSETLKCQECEKTFSSKSNLNKHRKKHVPGYTPNSSKQREKKFTCPEEGCEKTFDSRHALKSHQRCHTGERPFQCEQCSWRFTQKTHLTRHIKGVHEKIPRSKQSNGRSLAPVTCDLCNKVYVNSRVLAVHKQSVHNRLRPYKCDYCDATYTQRGHLWRHKHASHFEKEEVQKKYTTNKFCCNFDGCDQLFDTESELKEHVTSHVGTTDKACMCDECGATFAAQQNLFKHKKRRHSGPMPQPHKTHRCEKCDKSFFTSYQLVVHFRCHTGEKPYKCDLCGKDFVQKSGLRKHIRCKRCPMIEGGPINNKNSKKYACEQCDKMFPGPSDLKAHQRTHTGERPYVCETCGKGFSQPGNLTKHVRFVHKKEQRPKEKVREKKYFCSLCGKAFLCPSSLAMHCRTHSGDKPFSCEKCGQAFAQAGNLKKHTKRWHENGGGRAPRRRKAKDQNVFMETMESQKEIEPHEEHLSNQTPVAVQQGDSNVVISEADVTDLGSVPAQGFQDRQTTCTPLNTPSHLYAATPLNTAVPSSSQNPASQRIPVLFGFIAPLDPNTMSSAQVSESPVRIPTEQNGHANRANEGVAINAPSTPPQTTTTSLASMSAQELQQVVISRMLASENAEAAFLPPNLAGFATNSPPRAQVLLPHMHSLIASTGGNSVGEVTVWPFSANGGGFQQ